ncbi:MAG: hypothetical protein CFE21_12005 [Bacteroidetes bacterium B1(2017)]|nr:MAG: hypothetical protein CFE21_12005 [Bacteroidetes bacterium B1(2017)]
MKTIQRKDFVEVGSVVKVHGTKGELRCMLTREIDLKEWAFLEFRGKPVPFYIEGTKAESYEEIILKLRDIDSIEIAKGFIGKVLMLPKKQVKKDTSFDEFDILGYQIIDSVLGNLGEVEEIVEYPYQTLAKISRGEMPVLIPLVDGIVLEINDRKKTVLVKLPDGLLEIN